MLVLSSTYSISVSQPPTNGVTLTEQADYDYQMGLLTKITDPNGNQTTAGYDDFGRMTSLVKPGDSASYPTETIDYTDYTASQPFHTLVYQRQAAGSSDRGRPTSRFYDGLGRLIQTKQEDKNGQENIASE
ncbi:MAG: RHS repeat protein [Herpetosiphonaceae bacterium]|nr:RHS repeat protein [Herpetosiphonaceae bacterium]